MQVAVVGCGVYDNIRIRRRAAINNCRGLRVQWVAHNLANHRVGVVIFVEQIFATCPANELIHRWFLGCARQAEIRILER